MPRYQRPHRFDVGRPAQDKLIKMVKGERYDVSLGAAWGLANSADAGGSTQNAAGGVYQMWKRKGKPRRDAARVTRDRASREDLAQEAMIHLWQQELRCPMQSESWYIQSCLFHLLNCVQRGRSLDSPRRRSSRRSITDLSEPADSADRLRVFTAIFEEADRPDAAALRLRSEDGMKRMPWTAAEVRLMAGRIEAGSPDQKRWAIAVLAGAASQPEIPDRTIIFEAIATASSSAPEAKVREFAVTGLGSFANEARAPELLVGSLKDTAWHVRVAAVRALAKVKRTPEVQSALQRVEREDPDERVRRAAGEVRKSN